MFEYLRNFLSRHRRKFYLLVAGVGGIVLLSKVVKHKLITWQEQHAQELLQQQRKKQHYERTLDTSRMTVLNLLPNIRRVLERELDSDTFVKAIKEQPHKKLQLFEELKVIGFGRAICTIICGALATSVSHSMMMVLAANTIDNSTDDTSNRPKKTLSMEVQGKYLSCLQVLIEEQFPVLVSRIMTIIQGCVKTIPLTRKLTLAQLEVILQEICLSAMDGSNNSPSRLIDSGTNSDARNGNVKNVSSVSIVPWSQYFKEPEDSMSTPEESKQLHDLCALTLDILNTNDFHEVVKTLVNNGLNYVLDEVAGFYFNSLPFTKTKLSVSAPTGNVLAQTDKQDQTDDNDLKETSCQKKSSATSNSDDPAVDRESHGQLESCSDEVLSCVLVKLVPALNGLMHRSLPAVVAQNAFTDRLLICPQLEHLSYTVYTVAE